MTNTSKKGKEESHGKRRTKKKKENRGKKNLFARSQQKSATSWKWEGNKERDGREEKEERTGMANNQHAKKGQITTDEKVRQY